MALRKVDVDHQGWTYSSYVIAGDYIFTSICTGWGTTIDEHVENAILKLQQYLNDAKATLDDVAKVTVTLKRGENFEALKEVFRKYFTNGFPARNTILVDAFLNPNILIQLEAIAYKPERDVAVRAASSGLEKPPIRTPRG
jgi:2-iminobutanoate/2-iminopropanoate deaminase